MLQDEPIQGAPLPQPVRLPVTYQIEPVKDALQGLTPEMSWLIDTVGTAQQGKQSSQILMQNAMQNGETTGTMRKQVEAAEASEKALQMAEQSLQMNDAEFDSILQELTGEVENRPMMPEKGQAEAPSVIEQIITAGLSMAMPNQAFKIGSVPYQLATQRRDEQYQMNVQRYGEKMAQRSEKINLLETQLKIAESRRREAADEVRRLADDAFRKGETVRANALNLRSQIYDAKTPEEIDDRLRVMRENFPPEYLPTPEVVKGLKAQLKAGEDAAREKAKFEGQKEAADNEQKVIDDFVSWVNSNYPSGVSIGPAELKAINAERARVAESRGISVSKLPSYSTRTAPSTESLNFAKERYNEDTELRGIIKDIRKTELDQKKANLEKTLSAEPKESSEKKQKRKQIGSLTTKAESAKLALDQHLNKSPSPDDVSGEDYRKKMRDLFIDEYTIVAKKRQMVGAKVPSILDYYKERFNEDSMFFPAPIRGVIGDQGRGTSQQGTPPKPPVKGFGAPK